jgi:hypothetical protein
VHENWKVGNGKFDPPARGVEARGHFLFDSRSQLQFIAARLTPVHAPRLFRVFLMIFAPMIITVRE